MENPRTNTSILGSCLQSSTLSNMSDSDERETTDKPPADSTRGKKPFVDPEMKEFDDLEKQIKSPLIGTFTP